MPRTRSVRVRQASFDETHTSMSEHSLWESAHVSGATFSPKQWLHAVGDETDYQTKSVRSELGVPQIVIFFYERRIAK
jgi:hypothetical protein